MQTFDQSLFSLFEKVLITFDEALRSATNPEEIKLRKLGIQSTKDMAKEEMAKALSNSPLAEDGDGFPGMDELMEDHNLLEIE